MKGILRHIPNTLTLANLFCGCLAIVMVFSNSLVSAGFLILLAAVFDFLDGAAARLLKAYSPLGKELDSLADMVSFGVAPATIAFSIMLGQYTRMPFPSWAFIAFVMALFSALRLAKFNINTEQVDHFIGMPTPANALFWATLPMLIIDFQERFSGASWVNDLFHPLVIGGLCIWLAILLIVPWPMLSLKFKNFGFKQNWSRYLLLWIVLGLYFCIGIAAIPIGVLLVYPILSLLKR